MDDDMLIVRKCCGLCQNRNPGKCWKHKNSETCEKFVLDKAFEV